MAADKFEKHIKTRLDAREIAPSAAAWDAISQELGVQKQSKKTPYFWWGVAASVAIIVGSFLFWPTDSAEQLVAPQIVEKPLENNIREVNEPVLQNNIKEDTEVVVAHEQVQEEGIVVVEKTSLALEKTVLKDDAIPSETLRAVSEVAQTIGLQDKVIENKIAEVLAQVAILEQSAVVTDAEVDALLRAAQESIVREQLFKPDQSVDAMALLTQVEEELDHSFRDQIFQSLKAGFLKVRTAVADRNN